MNAAGRLGVYGAALVVAFGGAFGLAGALVPDSAVQAWQDSGGGSADAEGHAAGGHDAGAGDGPTEGHAGHGSGAEPDGGADSAALPGLSQSAEGYQLSPVSAPAAPGEPGALSFRILGPDGEALTDYTTSHEKDLHLIVVRSDGARFRHVHPELAADGTWSLPWQWEEAGSYRVYADFTPGTEGAGGLTLSRTVQVAGDLSPVVPQPSTVAEVDGYTVTLTGGLVAGGEGTLEFAVTRDGRPVTELEPYLGAYGHLVALREGDLAYLHVHPEGEAPRPGVTAGPEVAFVGEAPTAGRYLLYLDFQVAGQVRTAAFVVDAEHPARDGGADPAPSDGGSDPAPAEGGADGAPADGGADGASADDGGGHGDHDH
ncbi:hypothetical protein [Brachybacterium phenoliresistens]|uniref:Heavy metal-binding domain-containing protein n=1 Tax=Brachybacterium phenoliresistens TaxID=396014 RepID=Z9JP25_9MICO|nr:hypothetical protein [Brachybacterium phenoliresistens]EWS79773.1 hypothetical protein BF93_09635 [Brachybacterium phenoliresistens]